MELHGTPYVTGHHTDGIPFTLIHGCLTFWFSWAAFCENRLSWAADRKCNIVNAYKNNIYFINIFRFLIKILKKKKE